MNNKNQFAVPGKKGCETIKSFRHICIQEKNNTNPSLDFKKAFDSIDLNYV